MFLTMTYIKKITPVKQSILKLRKLKEIRRKNLEKNLIKMFLWLRC